MGAPGYQVFSNYTESVALAGMVVAGYISASSGLGLANGGERRTEGR